MIAHHELTKAAETYDQASEINKIPRSQLTQADLDYQRDLLGLAQRREQRGYVAGTAAFAFALAPLAPAYVLTSLGIATAETGVEWGIARLTGDDQFEVGTAFARNVVTNLATNWIGGAGWTRQAGKRLGLWGARQAPTFLRGVAYSAGRAVPVVTAQTALETTWLHLVERRPLGASFLQSAIGNVGGRAGFSALGAGGRWALRGLGNRLRGSAPHRASVPDPSDPSQFVIKRYGTLLPEEKLLFDIGLPFRDKKGKWVVVTEGGVQWWTNNPYHGPTMARIAKQWAQTGKYRLVTTDQHINKWTGATAYPDIKADVMGIRWDGKVDLLEVISPPSQTLRNQRAKLDKTMSQLPPNMRGEFDAVHPQRVSPEPK